MTTIQCDGPDCDRAYESSAGREPDPMWWCLHHGKNSYPIMFCSKACLQRFIDESWMRNVP